MNHSLLMILKWIGLILSPILVSIVIIILMIIVFFFQYRFIKKMQLPKSDVEKIKPPGVFERIFIMFPRQIVDDMFNRDPDAFEMTGLHMICGEQGSGKTISTVALLMDLKKRFPKVKVRTNMDYKYEDGKITHWKELVKNENGIYGQIEVLDEIQTWFNSLQSKDFPPEMITEISQQRKQRKMIVGTAQVFSRIAKPIREQTTFVYLPMTFLGCFTWVRVSKPAFWNDETQTFKRYIRNYFFIHTSEIRDAFDTYKKIEKYNAEGFKEDKLRLLE